MKRYSKRLNAAFHASDSPALRVITTWELLLLYTRTLPSKLAVTTWLPLGLNSAPLAGNELSSRCCGRPDPLRVQMVVPADELTTKRDGRPGAALIDCSEVWDKI